MIIILFKTEEIHHLDRYEIAKFPEYAYAVVATSCGSGIPVANIFLQFTNEIQNRKSSHFTAARALFFSLYIVYSI